jgi:hypothetical protein
VWAKKLDYNGPTLIAGYGIWWNIKWQSRNRAYQAHNVVNQLIENKKDCQDRNGGKNFFQDKEITQEDWDLVNRLNDILGVSFKIENL